MIFSIFSNIFGFCGHAATIKVRQNFICGHAATLPRSKNFEIDTPAKIGVDSAQNIFYESCNQSFNFSLLASFHKDSQNKNFLFRMSIRIFSYGEFGDIYECRNKS